jgi:hypothetical protein
MNFLGCRYIFFHLHSEQKDKSSGSHFVVKYNYSVVRRRAAAKTIPPFALLQLKITILAHRGCKISSSTKSFRTKQIDPLIQMIPFKDLYSLQPCY